MTNWSKYQEAIFDEVESGKGNLVVEALAGSGKTTTAVELINRVPQGHSILFTAFNKSIAEELKRRVTSKFCEVMTLHSLGLRTVSKSWGKVEVDDRRTFPMTDELLGTRDRPGTADELLIKRAEENDLEPPKPRGSYADYDTKDSLRKLVSLAKNTLSYDIEDLVGLVGDFSIDTCPFEPEEFSYLAQIVLDRCAERGGSVDFDDMVWLPGRLGLRTWAQWDYVIVDECFVGETPILLDESGTTKPIRELVEQQYSGKVMTFDERTGRATRKHVTGWHRKPINRPMVRVVVRRRGFKSDGSQMAPLTERIRYGNNILVCTTDHRIYRDGEWAQAGRLKPGDVVQIESAAPTAYPKGGYRDLYKHGVEGRKNLSRLMRKKNAAGTCGQNRRGGYVPRRGGNGTGPSPVETALLARLGAGWAPNLRVAIGDGQHPYHYEIDLADTERMLVLELDGNSHNSKDRKRADRRKDKRLTALGWTVVRLRNEEAVALTDELLHERLANSPVEAEVVSVEPYTPKDPWVYDITVEDTHCYYADGVLVHNCQDMNAAQLWLARRACKKSGRMVIIGDRRQAIYGFRGADPEAIPRMIDELSARVLPLSITYRCPRAVVELANTIVPELEAAPSAPLGEVRDATLAELLAGVGEGDAVISRTNAPLVSICLKLLRDGVRARIQGRDIGTSLAKLVKRSKADDVVALMKWMGHWATNEKLKLEAARRDSSSVTDRFETILALSDGCFRVSEVLARIERLFSDLGGGFVVLSTTHKAKGLEWPIVWMLDWTYRRYEGGEEANLFYVAVTRTKGILVRVTVTPTSVGTDENGEVVFSTDLPKRMR